MWKTGVIQKYKDNSGEKGLCFQAIVLKQLDIHMGKY
jgi:hypothetical protein